MVDVPASVREVVAHQVDKLQRGHRGARAGGDRRQQVDLHRGGDRRAQRRRRDAGYELVKAKLLHETDGYFGLMSQVTVPVNEFPSATQSVCTHDPEASS